MSRSRTGGKSSGWEFWSRRPMCGGRGKKDKKLCHGMERAQAKQAILHELSE